MTSNCAGRESHVCYPPALINTHAGLSLAESDHVTWTLHLQREILTLNFNFEILELIHF